VSCYWGEDEPQAFAGYISNGAIERSIFPPAYISLPQRRFWGCVSHLFGKVLRSLRSGLAVEGIFWFRPFLLKVTATPTCVRSLSRGLIWLLALIGPSRSLVFREQKPVPRVPLFHHSQLDIRFILFPFTATATFLFTLFTRTENTWHVARFFVICRFGSILYATPPSPVERKIVDCFPKSADLGVPSAMNSSRSVCILLLFFHLIERFSLSLFASVLEPPFGLWLPPAIVAGPPWLLFVSDAFLFSVPPHSLPSLLQRFLCSPAPLFVPRFWRGFLFPVPSARVFSFSPPRRCSFRGSSKTTRPFFLLQCFFPVLRRDVLLGFGRSAFSCVRLKRTASLNEES